MEIVEHSVLLVASQDVVWKKMVDWQDWPTWDCDMESVHFPDALGYGAVGRLKLKGGPKVLLCVTDFHPGESYISEFQLLGTRLIFGHTLKPVNESATMMTFTVRAQGLTAFLVVNSVKSKITKGLPEHIRNFQFGLQQDVQK
jgi:hypothetical protein